jgi:hypothetical protein
MVACKKETPMKRRPHFSMTFFPLAMSVFSIAAVAARPPKIAGRLGHADLVAPSVRPADVKSPEAIVQALYQTISGPAGPRNWDRFRSLFLPGARLITTTQTPGGSFKLVDLSVENYIGRAGDYFAHHGFYESEITHETQSFGQIAHVFSTYASQHAKNQPAFTRGINSIQLVNDGGRWWVAEVVWDSERPGNHIPQRYLWSDKRPAEK